MASGAAQFAELVWRVLATAESDVADTQANAQESQRFSIAGRVLSSQQPSTRVSDALSPPVTRRVHR